MPRIGGIVSGLDTDTILTQLKSIAQRPIAKLQARQTELTKKSAAWDAMSLKFSALRTAATGVTDKFSRSPAMATSSDTSLLGLK
jgi:flagellar capping protein FliD